MLTWPGVELPQGPRPQRAADRFGDVTIACEGLWKVFGPNSRRILDSEHAHLPRKELMAATGCVAAVRDVAFEVRAGEVFVVMGLSGSGKSTLIRCLSRLVEPTAGQVSLEGEDILAASEQRLRDLRRHKVSMVFQHFGLLPHRTVLHNVAFGLEVQGQQRTERLNKAAETLELVGLEGFGDSYPDELSGGMKQRVGLARALATDPDLLLFDEPFSALDPLIRRDMQAEVCRLQESVQKTMVFITHDLMEALKLGDRIAIMRDGDFVQVGTPEQVVGEPADDYVRDFTRDVPRTEVLTARAIMAPPRDAGDDGFGPSVWADTKLADLIPLVARDERPLCVFDEESRAVGVVDRLAVLGAMSARIETHHDWHAQRVEKSVMPGGTG